MKNPEDEIAERVKALVAERLVRYVRPAIRSVKVPLPQVQASPACNPYAHDCNPKSCSPPGPCGPWRP